MKIYAIYFIRVCFFFSFTFSFKHQFLTNLIHIYILNKKSKKSPLNNQSCAIYLIKKKKSKKKTVL
jgi:hypothetical protein